MKKVFLLLLFSVIFPAILTAQNEFYDIVPDINNCQEGKLKEIEKQNVLKKINAIRAIHGLKPVTYNYTKDILVQKSALMTAANEALSHTPPTNWKCYSNEGVKGAKKSNLHIRWYYGSSYKQCVDAVINWMLDMNVNVCGHRRWILDPFVKFIAFGRVDGASKKNPQFGITAASIYVIDDDKQNLSDWNDDFVAYPYHNYPSEIVMNGQGKYWHFHFTAVFNKNNWWDNKNVNYDNAVLSIKDDNGSNVQFNNVTADNSGYGVPNMLRFDLLNLEKDKRYNVTVKNVQYKGQTKDYSYWFKVSDNVGSIPSAPLLVSPSNNASEQPTELLLSWQQVPDAVSYNLQVATDVGFSQLFISKSNITATSFNLSSLEKETKYYWRVSGKNDIGTGKWSVPFAFTTRKGATVGIPVLEYPANNATEIPTYVKIRWKSSNGAKSYQLQIADNADFSNGAMKINKRNITKSFYIVPQNILKKDLQYWYRVRAFNTNITSDWSVPFTFWTEKSTLVEIEKYGADLLLTPNPSKGKINFVSKSDIIFDLQIFDINGKLLVDYINFHSNNEIDISHINTGSYIVVINIAGKNYFKKLNLIK